MDVLLPIFKQELCQAKLPYDHLQWRECKICTKTCKPQ